MFVIETASRACKITILIKRSKVRKVNHALLPEGIQIEGLLPCLVSQLALLAELFPCTPIRTTATVTQFT